MKRDQREKRYFYKICRFFLKLIFDRIFIPPPKKRLGYIGLLLSVRFVCPSGRHTFSSLRHTLNFARTGVSISELSLTTALLFFFILIPLLSTARLDVALNGS